MLEIDIPGFGLVRLEHLVSDFTGTLSVNGQLIPKVNARLNKLEEFMKIHILTADTFGKALAELKGINCEVHIRTGEQPRRAERRVCNETRDGQRRRLRERKQRPQDA